MLLMNKTLIKLARGLWVWILAIAAVSFLTLIGTTALAEIVGGFLGDLLDPETILGNEWSAVSAALLVLWYKKRGNKDKISFAIISIEE